MRKTIAVGAASIALAAMPIVGAFATAPNGTITDTLQATISSACEFTRYGAAGAASQSAGVETNPAWSGATSAAPDAVTGTYSAAFKPGTDVELGTSHFTGYCNATNGFSVTVATPSLTDSNSNTINFAGTAPDATTGQGWTLKKSDNSLFTNTGTDTVFMSASGPTDSSSTSAIKETATYTIYTNTTTKAGTYSGNVVYTFTYVDPAV